MTNLDLRTAFARHYFEMPKRRSERAFENDVDDMDDIEDDVEDDSAGEGGEGSSDNGSDDDDASSSPPSGKRKDDKGTEQIRDPEGYVRSAEAAKYRRERNEMRTQLEEVKRKLEGKQSTEQYEGTIRSLRLELAFERTANRRISDVEAAWRLAADDLKAVEIKDGKVDQKRLEEIVDHIATRYPYLTDDYATTENVVSAEAVGTSGRPVNGKRKSDVGLDRGALEARFPALRRMR